MDRLLLDTTYLLPLFGIDLKLLRFEELLPRLLERFDTLYNPVSLVEAKWLILRLIRRSETRVKGLLEAYRMGLKALQFDERLKATTLTDPEVEEIADRLLIEAGVRDYFDRLIYASAIVNDAILLTEDEELREIASMKQHPHPKGIMNWKEIIETVKG